MQALTSAKAENFHRCMHWTHASTVGVMLQRCKRMPSMHPRWLLAMSRNLALG